MIDLYLKYCQVLFEQYKGKVKYWITFNEINSILHQPFVSGAILTPKAQLSNQQLYQAIHYELVASAKAGPQHRPGVQGGQHDPGRYHLPAHPEPR